MFYCYQNWSDESLMQVKDNDLCYGQSRSNVVKNVLQLPTLAMRITKQVKDDDNLYEGQRSTDVIGGQGTYHRDDPVMSSLSSFCQHRYLSYSLHGMTM